jgi:GNAT superfamily N-acetyltransferase
MRAEPAGWRIEPLDRHHDRSTFDCGEPALDEFLSAYARQNQEAGVARTFVAVSKQEPARIVGYYSLAVGAIDRSQLPEKAARRFPRFPLPVARLARLARLAVDRSQQGRGLGEDLVIDALGRALRVSEEVGIIAILIDAKHDQARSFYARFRFEPLPESPLLLWLPVREARRHFGS